MKMTKIKDEKCKYCDGDGNLDVICSSCGGSGQTDLRVCPVCRGSCMMPGCCPYCETGRKLAEESRKVRKNEQKRRC